MTLTADDIPVNFAENPYSCDSCGERHENEPRPADDRYMPGLCLCDRCQECYEEFRGTGNVSVEATEDGLIESIDLPTYEVHDVVNGTIAEKWATELENGKRQGVKGDVSVQKQCAVCDASVAGDTQLLGKIVCHECFSDARNGNIERYRNVLRKKYGEDNLRDEDTDDSSEHTPASDDADRPDDYEEWTVEQWKSAYVDGEINIIALEIGVEHALSEEMDLSGPGSDKFERSVEIATELSDGPIKEEV